jgi:hypothetical protein
MGRLGYCAHSDGGMNRSFAITCAATLIGVAAMGSRPDMGASTSPGLGLNDGGWTRGASGGGCLAPFKTQADLQASPTPLPWSAAASVTFVSVGRPSAYFRPITWYRTTPAGHLAPSIPFKWTRERSIR